MTNARDRALAILQLLASGPPELLLVQIANQLDIAPGTAHRVLADLKEGGYVRQDRDGGPYRLTAKIVSLAFGYLAGNGISDVAQPVLDRLAEISGELVRLAVVDGEQLTWVAKAQRKRHGLLLDPDEGASVYLSAAANGHAWLSCFSDEAALELVARQGFKRDGFGPGAPRTIRDLLAKVQLARSLGYATVVDAYEDGTSAIAAPIIRRQETIATVSIAGPTVRMSEARMKEMVPMLLESASELAVLATGSPMFGRPGGEQRQSAPTDGLEGRSSFAEDVTVHDHAGPKDRKQGDCLGEAEAAGASL